MDSRIPTPRSRLTRRAFVVGGAALAGAAGFGLGRDEGNLRLDEPRLEPEGWRAGRVRIGFLADFHLNSDRSAVLARRSAEAMVAAKPDLVLLGGDYVDVPRTYRARYLMEFLDLFPASLPVLGILGNHDWQVDDGVARTFQAAGRSLLRNQVAQVEGVRILGLGSALVGEADYGLVDRAGPGSLLLLHEPDYAAHWASKTALTLCSHTHGGQICWPGGAPLHLPKGGQRFAAGEYRRKGGLMYVTRGVGVTGVPWRLYCPPEVTVLDVG